jgi:hypothetical protein
MTRKKLSLGDLVVPSPNFADITSHCLPPKKLGIVFNTEPEFYSQRTIAGVIMIDRVAVMWMSTNEWSYEPANYLVQVANKTQ